VEDLKTAQEQVIQQERLRALGSMASGIAHDFNNSLVGILGLTELLLNRPEDLEDKAKARHYLEMINTTAKDAGKIVDRLREFYRFREKRDALEAIDLNLLVDGAISLTQPRWKTQAEARNISIAVQRDLQDIPKVTGNIAELREVLTNLIFNAVDAMPLGGNIAIRTRCEGHQAVLEVSDTGHGMTEDIRRRCFEPFFTTKGTHGTGLGLSMVHGIVQRHQATIEVKSEVDKGSTFIIRFAPQSVPAETASSSRPNTTLQNLRVLVVDDEPMVRTIIGEYLTIDGHVVETANGGRDGVEKFGKDQFDLVVVDRAMPDMSGDQVATAIRSVNPSVPIVMLTGFGSMMEANGERPVAVDLVVGKPVTIVGLRAALSKAVAAHAA
jgi:CheY-like chemotaxis protein/anti-sigma regulatory factor (Ser/Thr protein kinase)